MRKVFSIAAATLMLIGIAGCSIPVRLNNFVNRTERNCYRYSIRDWEYSLEKYERLVKSYARNYTRYTTSEKRLAMNAIGRYHALLVKAGVKETTGVVYELMEYAGGLQDILRNDVGAFIDFLRNVLGLSEERIFEIRKQLHNE